MMAQIDGGTDSDPQNTPNSGTDRGMIGVLLRYLKKYSKGMKDNEKQIKKDAETCILFSIHINETFYPLIAISPPKKHLDPHFEVQPYKPPTLVALAM